LAKVCKGFIMQKPPDYLTVGQAAEELGVLAGTLRS
jgi:hypothetical protein